MGNVLSKDVATPAVRMRSDARVSDDGSFVMLHHEELGGKPLIGVASIRSLVNHNGILPIPMKSREALQYISTTTPWSSVLETQNRVYGVCVYFFAVSQKARVGDDDGLVLVSGIAMSPRLLERLADGENPKLVCTDTLKALKQRGVQYPSPPELPAGFIRLKEVRETTECYICMEAQVEYIWSQCQHPDDEGICVHCRRKLMQRQLTEFQQGRLLCPMCRTPGMITRSSHQRKPAMRPEEWLKT